MADLRNDAGKTLIMGILNVTPDSFSDGGMFFDANSALIRVKQMAMQGADMIDVGGESSRPGSKPVSAATELSRVLPVVKRIASEMPIPISIDTYKPQVAEECIKYGAAIINDISGMSDPAMRAVAAKYDATVVIMHMQGTPQTMQNEPQYTDVVAEIKEFFKERITACENDGINKIIIDPGIGFGKTLAHNLEIMRRLHEFKELGYPLLVGTSRKSFIKALTGARTNEELLSGTLATVSAAALAGADIVRVHDVLETARALAVADSISGRRQTI